MNCGSCSQISSSCNCPIRKLPNNKVNLYHHGNQLLIFPGTENRLGSVSRNNERKRREIIYIRQLLYCNLITVKSSYFVVCSRMADLLGVKKILSKSHALTSFLWVQFQFSDGYSGPFHLRVRETHLFQENLAGEYN